MKVSGIEDGDSNKVIQRAEEIINNKSQHNIKIFPEVKEDRATMHKDQEATVPKKKKKITGEQERAFFFFLKIQLFI